MPALTRRRIAFALLLAALAQPAWAVAHAGVHEHMAQHHGDAVPHHPASSHDAHESGPHPSHEHTHVGAMLVRPTRDTDSPSPVALPAATPRPSVVATQPRRIDREAVPSRASVAESAPLGPRAPPIP
jgi:hypothetical protein